MKNMIVIDSTFNEFCLFMDDLFVKIYKYRQVNNEVAQQYFLLSHYFNRFGKNYYMKRDSEHDKQYRYTITKQEYEIELNKFLQNIKTFLEITNV